MVWFNFFPSELHEGRGAGDSADRGLPSRPAALTGTSRLWVTLGASLQHQAVLQEEPVHLSFASSLCSHPLQLCQMPFTSCNFYPVPREGGGCITTPRLHHLPWVRTRGQPQLVWNTRVFLSPISGQGGRVCTSQPCAQTTGHQPIPFSPNWTFLVYAPHTSAAAPQVRQWPNCQLNPEEETLLCLTSAYSLLSRTSTVLASFGFFLSPLFTSSQKGLKRN